MHVIPVLCALRTGGGNTYLSIRASRQIHKESEISNLSQNNKKEEDKGVTEVESGFHVYLISQEGI